ncbi:MAG: hypothetical protein H7318_14285 [Oligoflexus sp.]|nr:hypothetical protein [Oligoflexus sp.]
MKTFLLAASLLIASSASAGEVAKPVPAQTSDQELLKAKTELIETQKQLLQAQQKLLDAQKAPVAVPVKAAVEEDNEGSSDWAPTHEPAGADSVDPSAKPGLIDGILNPKPEPKAIEKKADKATAKPAAKKFGHPNVSTKREESVYLSLGLDTTGLLGGLNEYVIATADASGLARQNKGLSVAPAFGYIFQSGTILGADYQGRQGVRKEDATASKWKESTTSLFYKSFSAERTWYYSVLIGYGAYDQNKVLFGGNNGIAYKDTAKTIAVTGGRRFSFEGFHINIDMVNLRLQMIGKPFIYA